MNSERVIQVALLTKTRALSKPLDYLLSEQQEVEIGALLDVPVGKTTTLGVVVRFGGDSSLPDTQLRQPLAIYDRSLWLPVELVQLANWAAVMCCSPLGRVFALMVAPRKVKQKVRLKAYLTSAGEGLCADKERLQVFTEKQQSALALLQSGECEAGAYLQTFRGLEKRGFVDVRSAVVVRRPQLVDLGNRTSHEPNLTLEQQSAISVISPTVREEKAHSFLIHGVTGSGKTEIYLQLAKTALEHGKTVLVLVPEIALTPQTVSRFTDRFGETVAVIHSGLSSGERFDEWQRLQSGEARICVGARSAVFAPLRSVGLIIVDEEHDSSYKNEGDPRYDAREVASYRAQLTGATLIGGSATPRPESVHSSKLVRLAKRVDGSPLPTIKLVDMRKTRAVLHPDVIDALTVNDGKAVLLLNRRGWSNFLECQTCGHSWECPNCDVTLVLHNKAGFLACHHCGYRVVHPQQCTECGSVSITRHGIGTERLEEVLCDLHGGSVPVFRLDRDVGKTHEVLAGFAKSERGILIGTQMIAKGHDFPDVTLGVVLDLDGMLRFPDFRAEERTFGLVTQLAGRVGRGSRKGRVFVQTLVPDAGVLKLAAEYRAEDFLKQELKRRSQLLYPPYATLVRIICSAHKVNDARRASTAIYDALQADSLTQDALSGLLGPAPLFRLKGFEREQLLLKVEPQYQARLLEQLDDVVAKTAKAFRHVRLSIDVHPQ